MSRNDNLTRRRFVSATTAAAALGLAGCSDGGDGGDDGGGDGGGDGGDGGDGNGGNGEALEVLHGWTGGDGALAAEALVEAYGEQFPDTEHEFNAIGGGGNQNLDAVVANRLSNDNPPSSFANWPGKNLNKYEGVLGNVDDVWADNNFEEAHVDEAIDLHQQNGAYRAVPLGSHRLNNLFYNVEVVEEAGVDPGSLDSVDAMVEAFDAVASETDAVPFSHLLSAPWATVQLFGTMFISQHGVDTYNEFIGGNPDEEAVTATFEAMASVMENYISDDASSIGLTESNGKILDGSAAFIHQGNWAAGAYRNADDFAYEEDWGAIPFPGTEGIYELHFDSFLYPANNPTPRKTKDFLGFIGGEDAQIAFNQFKGSIPTRTDVDMSEFGPYLQDAQEDFANADARPRNLFHGLGIVAEVRTAMSDTTSSEFTGPFDVDAAASGFVDAVSN